MNTRTTAIQSLQNLGLNQLEAEVYVFLLGSEPLTAYAVGKAIGRATANVYKAVESLSRAGAVLVEEGDTRVCRATPQDEFLSRAGRDFKERTQAAEQSLSHLRSEHFDERVYRIEAASEVFERCARMLESATTVIVVDAFPRALEEIAPDLERAAKRGVDVRVEAYRPTRIKGCDVVVASTGEDSVRQWRAEQLNVVVDGRQVLLALVDESLRTVHQAIWSASLYLSCLIHSGRLSEHTIHRVKRATASEPASSPSRKALRKHRFFIDGKVPGQLELFERYATDATQGGLE